MKYRMNNTNNSSEHLGNSNYKNKNSHRKIWFNPPSCKLTNINIGKYFLNLIEKHFQKTSSKVKYLIKTL